MTNNQITETGESAEITLADLYQFITKYFLLVILGGILGGIGGVLYSFTKEKTYTAQTILLPEYSMSNNNSFFSMASGGEKSGAEKLTPDLYPNVLKSIPFGQYLLTVPVTDEKNKNYATLRAYLQRENPSPSVPISAIPGQSNSLSKTNGKQNSNVLSNILRLSAEENSLIMSASSFIRSSVEARSGITTLECEMTDPVVAAQLVEISKNYLVKYIEEYRTSKTYEQVSFLTKRVSEAKIRQQNAEYALQSYRDQNRGAFLNVARIAEQRLQAEYTLSQSIYSDLTIKLEQAKIRMKEEKPVFKVLEPSKIPLDKSSPNRPLLGLIFAAIGSFLVLAYIVFFKEKLHLKILQ